MTKHRNIIRAALIAVFLLMYFANTTRASEPVWPQFRGPGGAWNRPGQSGLSDQAGYVAESSLEDRGSERTLVAVYLGR